MKKKRRSKTGESFEQSVPWRQVVREFQGGFTTTLLLLLLLLLPFITTGVLVEPSASRVQKRDIEFSIFWLKRPCKSYILRFFLKIRFFFRKALVNGRFFAIFSRRPYGRWAVTAARFLSNFWGPFFVIFSRLTLTNGVF